MIVCINADHEIPCTFTAKIILHAKYSGKKHVYNYTQYSIKDKMMTQEGIVPQGYPFPSSKLIYKAPASYTIADPMFDDHIACAILPVGYDVFPCFAMDFDAKLDASNINCPRNSYFYNESIRCDRWTYRDIKEAYCTWYFFTDTFTPVQYEYDGDYYELYNFISFDPTEPKASAFDPPKGAICEDLTKPDTPITTIDSYASRFSGFHGMSIKSPRNTMVNDAARIASVNAEATSWKAGPSRIFNGMTVDEAARKLLRPPTLSVMGQNLNIKRDEDNFFDKAPEYYNIDKIPASFDASKAWPNCAIDHSRPQGDCGSCWAFGSTLTLGNRFCIARNDTSPLELSPQYAVSCFKNLNGCDGGYTDVAWMDLRDIGTVEESCVNYHQKEESCWTHCNDGSPLKLYKAANAYPLYVYGNKKKTMESIQKDILVNGPVEAAFWVFDDFFNYVSGVYQRSPNATYAGGHTVKVYGWGVDEESGLPYWLAVNSWEKDWGQNGCFRILRGTNECSFEDEVAAGLPLIKQHF